LFRLEHINRNETQVDNIIGGLGEDDSCLYWITGSAV